MLLDSLGQHTDNKPELGFFCQDDCGSRVRGWCAAYPGRHYVNPAALSGCPKLERVQLLYIESLDDGEQS